LKEEISKSERSMSDPDKIINDGLLKTVKSDAQLFHDGDNESVHS
jgi:hypothetical protein